MLSIMPPAINNIAADLRRSYRIPKDKTVIVALIVGYSKFKYRQAIKRPLKEGRFLSPESSTTA